MQNPRRSLRNSTLDGKVTIFLAFLPILSLLAIPHGLIA